MFIRSFHLVDYMVHRNTKIDLNDFVMLTGNNNSGKSAIFDGLVNCINLSTRKINQVFEKYGPYSFKAKKHNRDGAASISYIIDFANNKHSNNYYRYSLELEQIADPDGFGKYSINNEKLESYPNGNTIFSIEGSREELTQLSNRFKQGYVYQNQDLRVALKNFYSIGKYQLIPFLLAKPSSIPDLENPRGKWLGYKGEDLPSLLYFLSEKQRSAYEAIVEIIKTAISGFEGFEFPFYKNEHGSDDLVGFSVKFSDSRNLVESRNLSSGTLSLIGWITLLHSPNRRQVLLLEEPEMGLTPKSTIALFKALQHVVSIGGAQIIVSTHSPILVAAFRRYYPENPLLIMTSDEEGVTPISYQDRLDELTDDNLSPVDPNTGLPSSLIGAPIYDISSYSIHHASIVMSSF